MKVYHAKFENREDDELQRIIDQSKEAVAQIGGEVHLSKGFSTTPALIVLSLPDEVNPASVFADCDFKEGADTGQQ